MDGFRIFVLIITLGGATLGAALPAVAQNRAQAEAELEAVRERIQILQSELQRENKRKSRAEQALREFEQAEQRARRQLQVIRKDSQQARQREAELRRQASQQQRALEAQKMMLSQQLRVVYTNGEEEWLRVLLSQEDAAAMGRRMTYYGYLNKQRADAIRLLRVALDEIAQTRQQIGQELRRLQRLEAESADKLEEIANTRADRAAVVARIRKKAASQDAEIKALLAQAEELSDLVARLANVLPDMPNFDASPFAGQAAQLEWPTTGAVLKRFGQARADGSLKWNGVLLGAKAGSEVRAVYHGRVVFADWLSGMGLLTIIEHDEGYMSLYGHNQDLLKEVGEWVSPGEAIAHAGDSGGQAAAGLYFEIRKDGEPVDPRRWIK